MAQRAQRSLETARTAVPEGTFAVGAGLLVAGITAYAFQIVSFRALSKGDYTALNGLWVLVFVVAPGMFLPLEQEVGRALADRRARGDGGGPLVKRAALLGGILTAALIVAALAAGGPLSDNLFHGRSALLVCFAIALASYAVEHLTRGTLSGNGRFGPYGLLLAIEGVVRVAPVIVLWLAGIDDPLYYGLALAIPPALSSAIALSGQHGLFKPGPDAPYSELSTALGYLFVGSLLAQTLGYAAVLGATVLATAGERDAVADFIVGFFLARIPILLFQAVQAALLPKLASLAGAGRHDDFKTGLRRLVVVVVGIGVIGVVAGFTAGPWAGGILFGEKFTLGHRDLALLAAGSGAFILALTLAQALIALMGHAKAAAAWVAGIVAFVVVTAVGDDLFLRVELGYLAGSLVSVVAMGALLLQRIAAGVPDSVRPLVEALEHEPLEI
ncbi:MAG: lipopolysaccharide biosynthesis protein [Actinomycetota bacterium]